MGSTRFSSGARVLVLSFVTMLASCQPGGEMGPAPVSPTPHVAVGDGSLRVTWEPVADAARYRLYFLDTAGSPQRVVLSAQDVESPAVVTGLHNGHAYHLALTALGQGGESAYSEIVSAMPRPAPEAPREITASSVSGAVTLQWPSVETADDYTVYVARSDGVVNGDVASAPALLGVSQTALPEYTEPNLINGVEYSFVITARNSSGEGVASQEIKATPGPYKSLSSGAAHTCVIDAQERLWCWGSSSAGQVLGVNRDEVSHLPVVVAVGVRWKRVAAGEQHTCGVGDGEAMLCWGNHAGVEILSPPLRQNPIPFEDQWTSLSSNNMRSCGTRGDGRLICWSSGFTFVPSFLPMTVMTLDTDWLDVAMNPERAFMRKQDRSLWAAYHGQDLVQTLPIRLMEDERWTRIASSSMSLHFCAINDTGAAWCAGQFNDRGASGRGLITGGDALFAPVTDDGTSRWIDIATGADHSCGVKEDGSLWCWGANDYGQLGIDARADQLYPVRTGEDAAWSRVVAGSRHTCAMQRDGTIWCVGRNEYGQLGSGQEVDAAELKPVLDDVTSMAVSGDLSCALRRDESAWCWGKFADNDGSFRTTESPFFPVHYGQSHVPVRVADEQTFKRLMGLGGRLCGVSADGALWCWGSGSTASEVMTPQRVADTADWEQAVIYRPGSAYSSDYSICTLRADSTVWCTNTLTTSLLTSPLLTWSQKLGGATKWTQLVSGGMHLCALNDAQELWCWGNNDDGQVGVSNAARTSIPSPTRIGATQLWRSVVAAAGQTCAIAAGGTLWCWGNGSSGQASFPRTPTQVGVDSDWDVISVGDAQICARKLSGEVWCNGRIADGDVLAVDSPWRVENFRVLPAPHDGSTWSAVDSGARHSCALSSAGTVYCWGRNDQGQIGDGKAWSTQWQQVKFPEP